MIKALGFFFVFFFLIIPVLVVFLFIKFVSKRAKARKESSWEGKLADKDHSTYEDDEDGYTKDIYTLIFETNDGRKKLNVPKEVFDKFKVGDKAKKEEGQMHPTKVK